MGRRDAFAKGNRHPAVVWDSSSRLVSGLVLLVVVFIGLWNGGARAAAPTLDGRLRALQVDLERGARTWDFQPVSGYLLPLLDSLGISVDSQVAVFSPTSSQANLISPDNPRVIYFGDDVAVGWVRGSQQIEIAEFGSATGPEFYTLNQQSMTVPRLVRGEGCSSCHQSARTSNLPGLLVLSSPGSYGAATASQFQSRASDDRMPLRERWGGWYVTGRSAGWRHLGNRIGQGWLESLWDQFYTDGYPTEYSDVVALMVLEHQAGAVNRIARVANEFKGPDDGSSRRREALDDLANYLLFVDEAPFPARIVPTSGFVDGFEASGPGDASGRSLRQFDLQHRLFRYPCSFMIYSAAFDSLPNAAKDGIYARVYRSLSRKNAWGDERPDNESEAALAILAATKADFANYLTSTTHVGSR